MKFAKVFDKLSSFRRDNLIGILSCIFSLFYHISIFVFFLYWKVYVMVYYNFFSLSIFSILLILIINKTKKLLIPYLTAALEVIIHQVLAGYFLGSDCCFHYFILVMGLLPYLIFGDNLHIAFICSLITITIYITLGIITFPPIIIIPQSIVITIKIINISISVIMIVSVTSLFTIIVNNAENKLNYKNEILKNEIEMASVIQQNFFKQKSGKINTWDLAYYNKPMAGVSGDLYDIYRTGKKLDGLGLFDVSGHGISAGLVTMLVKNIIHQEFYNDEYKDLWEKLNCINDRVIEEKGEIENYLTGILLRIKEKKVEYVSAGHPMPILYKKSHKTCEYLPLKDEHSGVIGIPDFPTFFKSHYINLEKGDELILYTDGVTDLENEKGEVFGSDRFLQLVSQIVENTAQEQIDMIIEYLNEFRHNTPQVDDITIIVLKNDLRNLKDCVVEIATNSLEV